MNDRTNETATGYSYAGQQYKKQTKVDSQGNTYTVDTPISNIVPAESINYAPASPSFPQPGTTPNYNQSIIDTTSPYIFQSQMQNDLAKQQSEVSDVQALQRALSGKSAFEAEQNQATGLNTASEDYIRKQAELSALNKQAAAAQQENIAQGRQLGSVASFVAGQGSEIERNRAIRALNIGAELDAIQGNIAIAQMKVKNAVDAKYAPLEQDIKNRLQMFDLNSKLIQNRSEAEQKAWERAKYAVEREDKRVAEEKKNFEDIQNMIIEATPNAPATVVANAKKIAEKGGSKLAVAQALGVYGGDYLKTQLLKAQIDTEKAQKARYYADIDKIKSEMSTKGLPTTTANIAKVEASQSAYDLANELKTLSGKGGAVGAGFGKAFGAVIPGYSGTAFAGSDRANYEAKFNQLKDTLAASNLDKLKGAMSDKDIEFLRNIGTALNLSMSETAFDAELDKVANVMAQVPGVQKRQTQVQSNPFLQSLGVQPGNYSGTNIITNVTDNGDIQFAIPK